MTFYDNFENIPAIYIVKNSVNGKCYVGETLKLHKRISDHRARVKTKKSSKYLIHKAIEKYGYDKFSIYVEYFPDFNKDDLWDLEEQLILKFDSLTPNGYNMCSKGRGGVTGMVMSRESRKKMSDNSWNKGKIGKDSILSKPVYVYSGENGDFVGEYIGYTEAARQLNLKTHSAISNVLSGVYKQYKGYIFKTEYCGNTIPKIKCSTKKKIQCDDIKTGDSTFFDSVMEASKILNLSRTSIRNFCMDGKIHNNRIFKYFDN